MDSQQTESIPVTALLPIEAGVPIIVFDSSAALRMAVVDRASVGGLDAEWDAPGVYLLLDPVVADGCYDVYVGKAPAGIRCRLAQHAGSRGKEHWVRALAIIRDTTHGWHSAQVGWLEGRIHEHLEGATCATLSNKNRPQDETVPAYERAALAAAVEPITALMRLLGYSPDTADDTDTPAGRRSAPRQYNVTMPDLLDAGLLTAGEQVVSVRGTVPGTGTLNSDGTIQVDGQRFSSPSAAGRTCVTARPPTAGRCGP